MGSNVNDNKNVRQMKSLYSASKTQKGQTEHKDLKKAMRDARASFEKMKKIQEQLSRAYAEISTDQTR